MIHDQPLPQVATHSFQANAGDVVSIIAVKVFDSVWSKITLFAPSGEGVVTATHPTTARIESGKLTQSGAYILHCQDGFNGAGVGSYRLTRIRFPLVPSVEDPDGGAIRSGTVRFGTLGVGDLDGFAFDANEGDRVTLNLVRVEGDVWPEMVLHDPDGTVCLRIVVGLLSPAPEDMRKRVDTAPRKTDGGFGDGNVSLTDVTRILRIAIGLDPKL